jgi:hypothetical protein
LAAALGATAFAAFAAFAGAGLAAVFVARFRGAGASDPESDAEESELERSRLDAAAAAAAAARRGGMVESARRGVGVRNAVANRYRMVEGSSSRIAKLIRVLKKSVARCFQDCARGIRFLIIKNKTSE